MIVRGRGTISITPLFYNHPKSLNLQLNCRYELLLLAVSSDILRHTLPKDYRSSRTLALSSSPSPSLLQIHCLMHLSRLSADVRRRHQIHHQTQSFSRLLHTKHHQLTQKEAAQTKKINYPSIVQDCRSEESRWERNWTTIKAEYILDTLKETLTPVPPTDFFSQTYEEAFKRHDGPEKAEKPKSIVVGSSASIRTSIANLGDMERDLEAQIARLETVLGPLSPSHGTGTGTSSATTTTPRKGVRKSLPPTPVLTSSSSPRGRLEFTRSYSRLERRASESPLRGRGLISEHGMTD